MNVSCVSRIAGTRDNGEVTCWCSTFRSTPTRQRYKQDHCCKTNINTEVSRDKYQDPRTATLKTDMVSATVFLASLLARCRTMVKMMYGSQRKPRASGDCGAASRVEFAADWFAEWSTGVGVTATAASAAKTVEPIEAQFGNGLVGVHAGATWRIRMIGRCAAASAAITGRDSRHRKTLTMSRDVSSERSAVARGPLERSRAAAAGAEPITGPAINRSAAWSSRGGDALIVEDFRQRPRSSGTPRPPRETSSSTALNSDRSPWLWSALSALAEVYAG